MDLTLGEKVSTEYITWRRDNGFHFSPKGKNVHWMDNCAWGVKRMKLSGKGDSEVLKNHLQEMISVDYSGVKRQKRQNRERWRGFNRQLWQSPCSFSPYSCSCSLIPDDDKIFQLFLFFACTAQPSSCRSFFQRRIQTIKMITTITIITKHYCIVVVRVATTNWKISNG